ncbi:MAG: hypothetical protein KF795_21715 [Labilithrix sp.]|nr:hypothetical protein [Labilithrix sp.]
MEEEAKSRGDRASSSDDGAGDPRPEVPSKRASTPPSRPPADGRSAHWRLLVALVWIAAQATLVVTAGRRSDGAFGFRMFSESSTMRLVLHREIDDGIGGARVRVHVDDGVWSARAEDGTNHRLTWYDRVPAPYWVFDREMHASYGAAAQLERLQAALDDVASHLPTSDDLETRRFVLDVTVRRNGREPVVHHLTSRERLLPAPSPSHARVVDRGPDAASAPGFDAGGR